ncbi:MAG: GLPGLI family protein [Gelidibacter sp.]
MKYKQKLSVLVTLFTVMMVNAQDFQGIATYKSHRKFDFNDDNSKKDSKVSPEMQKQIEDQLRQQSQQEYTLNFNRNESIYTKNEKLAAPMPSRGGITINFSDGADVRYKNLKEQRFTNQTEVYGKQFLIKDSLKGQQWELLNEMKNIGQYTCFKAQITEQVKTRTVTEDGFETIMKERITTAWYTPQIPVSNGPAEFGGLPGLILEINDGKLTLICSKIVLNPVETIRIDEPRKGKVVTQQEFKDIIDKKSKEMLDQLNPGRKGGSVIFHSGG